MLLRRPFFRIYVDSEGQDLSEQQRKLIRDFGVGFKEWIFRHFFFFFFNKGVNFCDIHNYLYM